MGQLVTIYRQPETLQAFQLVAYSDMADALNYLQSKGHTGHITVDGNGNWQLWFQSTVQDTSYTAGINDWVIVKNQTIGSTVPNSQAAQLYTETPPS